MFPVIIGHKDSIKYRCPFFCRSIELVRQATGATLGHEAKKPNKTTLGQDQQGTCSSSNLPDLTKCLWSEFDFSHPVYKRELCKRKMTDNATRLVLYLFGVLPPAQFCFGWLGGGGVGG